MLLDITGILFAAQLVILLGLGPYADYGNWRPYIMMGRLFRCWLMLTNMISLPGYPVYLSICHVWTEPIQSMASRPGAVRDRFPV